MKTKSSDDSANASLGKRLRKFRAALNLRQTEMADHLDVSVSLYTKIESDGITPSRRTLARIAEKLDTTVDYLLTGNKAQKNANNRAIPSSKYRQMPVKEELRRMDDDTMRTIVKLLLNPQLNTLAKNVARQLDISINHARAMIIHTIMLDPTGKLPESIGNGDPT